MPELPEVETIKLGLEGKIIGLKIIQVDLLEPKSFQGDSKKIINQTVKNIWRRGKVLGIDLSGDLTLMIHLKMSGQLIYEGKDRFSGGHPTSDINSSMPVKSTRVIFLFSDKSKLFFNDQRKFGWVKLVDTNDLKTDKFLSKLGPEPLINFNLEDFINKVKTHKKSNIKSVILDQTVIAGVGNIYACEALFLAKIHPAKSVSDLSDDNLKLLASSIIKVLNLGIKKGGSSKTHYFNIDGGKGYFLDVACVYDREGLECKICKTAIAKVKISGRGSYFCPNCQI